MSNVSSGAFPSDLYRLHPHDVETLLSVLRDEGYQVVGPTPRDGVIDYQPIEAFQDLPIGLTDSQAPGRYRMVEGSPGALFHYGAGPTSWKRYLYPPEQKLFSVTKTKDGLAFQGPEAEETKPFAFLGVLDSDVRALAILAKVLGEGEFQDPGFRERFERTFIIAVNSAAAAQSGFAMSEESAGEIARCFDLRLTEILEPGPHRLLLEIGSKRGAAVVEQLSPDPATQEDVTALEDLGSLQPPEEQGIPRGVEVALAASLESAQWEEIAERCLSCANCTMVCPTCFCSSVEEVSDLTGEHAERWRRWDSCFTSDFSYIHGGEIRRETGSRYRQWMTHKLLHWKEQFGTSGCVGCGRCVTWCPVGIDISLEARRFVAQAKKGE